MAKKKKSTAVAKKDEGGKVAPEGLMESILADQGAGHEAMKAEDMALPFLYLLQDMNSQVKKRDEEYVEGAEPGMFYENISKTLWEQAEEKGILAIPCFFNAKVIEWIPRAAGGGFVAIHETMEDAIMNQDGRRFSVKVGGQDQEIPTDLVQTHQHFLLVQKPDGEWTPVLFPMTSTKLKSSRRWNAAIAQQSRVFAGHGKVNLPRFGCVWRLQSAHTENDKGDFFVTKTPELVEDVSDREDAEELYGMAKAFYTLCSAGEAKVDYSKFDGETPADGEEEAGDGAEF